VNPFALLRSAAAQLAARARHVSIAEERLAAFARELADAAVEEPGYDTVHHYQGDAHSTLAFILTLDAINFGSGWFPHLAKRPKHSGYLTVASALKERFEGAGPLSAADLQALEARDVAGLLGQDASAPQVATLMELFARALRDLGAFVDERFGGRFEGVVEFARGSAAELVGLLAEMPLYADVSRYEELELPFYKRAQITVADLALAFEGRGPGRFRDIDDLTIFADNLVPHVLRREGVLAYDDALAARVEAGSPLPPGSEEEVEIRACAVHAVERCAEIAAGAGKAIPVRHLDWLLWTRGQSPEMKAHPRHRTRTTFY
jgi:hypothetical protein